jgi:hypothetical protein
VYRQGLKAAGPGIDSLKQEDTCHFFISSLGPTQPHVKRVTSVLLLGLNGKGVRLTAPFHRFLLVKNKWSHNSISFRVEANYNVRFEVFTALTMKKVVFWDIKTQLVLHRRHIPSLLQSTAG